MQKFLSVGCRRRNICNGLPSTRSVQFAALFAIEGEDRNGNYSFSALFGPDVVEAPPSPLATSICDLNCRTKSTTREKGLEVLCVERSGEIEQAATLSYVNFFLGSVRYWGSSARSINQSASIQCTPCSCSYSQFHYILLSFLEIFFSILKALLWFRILIVSLQP
jgi:hypothetical protein